MPELPYDQEILDVVNENDVVIGTTTHEAVFDTTSLKGSFVSAVNAFLMRSDGKIWIPRRTHSKRIAPDGLDYSMGEHVMSGESYIDGAVRGFDEELNLQVTADELEYFHRSIPYPGGPPYFCENYIYHSDNEPDYNHNDFVSAEWLTPQELIARMKQGEKGKLNIIEVTEALLRYQTQRTSN
jgi:isopentenyldiphosphate isomerase